MPLLDITKPEIINFLNESYEKTARLRFNWIERNKNRVAAAAVVKNEKGYTETDVLRESVAMEISATTRDYVSSASNRRRHPPEDPIIGIKDLKKGHSIPEVGLGDPIEDPRLVRPDTDLAIDPIMRPVDPKHTAVLNKDLPFYGRRVYLKQRNSLSPEDKYYFQESGGWEWGWRMKDSYFGRPKPMGHGKVFRLTHGMRVRTGPQPDPIHYKKSDPPGVTKCLTE